VWSSRHETSASSSSEKIEHGKGAGARAEDLTGLTDHALALVNYIPHQATIININTVFRKGCEVRALLSSSGPLTPINLAWLSLAGDLSFRSREDP
jgi:hypothetical protein